jgi:hypothetical protein
LPAGQYVIKVAARSSSDVTSSISCSATSTTISLPKEGAYARGINTSGVASWSDSDTFARGGDNNDGFGWQWRFLPFTLDEETEVTMTVSGVTTKQFNWMSVADGELLSANDVATAVSYNEGSANTIANVQIANVTMTRNIKAGVNTVVLPFNLTANQVAAAYGTGTEVYDYSATGDEDEVTISFTKGDGSISANVPVLVKATEASSSQNFNGVQIVAAEAKKVGDYYDFVGTYEPITIAAGDYFIGTSTQDQTSKLFKSSGSTSMKAFRAYIHEKTPGAARIMKFFIGGEETTAIEGLEIVRTNSGKIYNLNGQEVKSTRKGVYVQDGKKIVVK